MIASSHFSKSQIIHFLFPIFHLRARAWTLDVKRWKQDSEIVLKDESHQGGYSPLLECDDEKFKVMRGENFSSFVLNKKARRGTKEIFLRLLTRQAAFGAYKILFRHQSSKRQIINYVKVENRSRKSILETVDCFIVVVSTENLAEQCWASLISREKKLERWKGLGRRHRAFEYNGSERWGLRGKRNEFFCHFSNLFIPFRSSFLLGFTFSMPQSIMDSPPWIWNIIKFPRKKKPIKAKVIQSLRFRRSLLLLFNLFWCNRTGNFCLTRPDMQSCLLFSWQPFV